MTRSCYALGSTPGCDGTQPVLLLVGYRVDGKILVPSYSKRQTKASRKKKRRVRTRCRTHEQSTSLLCCIPATGWSIVRSDFEFPPFPASLTCPVGPAGGVGCPFGPGSFLLSPFSIGQVYLVHASAGRSVAIGLKSAMASRGLRCLQIQLALLPNPNCAGSMS